MFFLLPLLLQCTTEVEAFATAGGIHHRSRQFHAARSLSFTKGAVSNQAAPWRERGHRQPLEAVPNAVAVAAAGVAVPPLKAVLLASFIPSLLGYYKSEYGVSYAYGTAMATTAYMVLKNKGLCCTNPTIAGIHALAVFFYGIRLNLFLLYREVTIPAFREFRERIEERAKSRGGRIKRTPFILSCAALYVCMTAPILATCRVPALCQEAFFSLSGSGGAFKLNAIRFLVGTTWFGFLLGAVGDLTKTWVKNDKGKDHLVTSGVFRWFRHPNYTGETIAWTSSALAACVMMPSWGGVAASLIGALGIDFILVQAATNLEKRQKEKYGESKEYKSWTSGSWAGITKSAEE